MFMPFSINWEMMSLSLEAGPESNKYNIKLMHVHEVALINVTT